MKIIKRPEIPLSQPAVDLINSILNFTEYSWPVTDYLNKIPIKIEFIRIDD